MIYLRGTVIVRQCQIMEETVGTAVQDGRKFSPEPSLARSSSERGEFYYPECDRDGCYSD